MTSITSTGSIFPGVQKYEGDSASQLKGTVAQTVVIEGERLLKEVKIPGKPDREIKVRNNLTADNLKLIKIKFIKGQDGKLYIEFTEKNKATGESKDRCWEIGGNVQEFEIKKNTDTEIWLTISYNDKTPNVNVCLRAIITDGPRYND